VVKAVLTDCCGAKRSTWHAYNDEGVPKTPQGHSGHIHMSRTIT
jgi:hypothetical protein